MEKLKFDLVFQVALCVNDLESVLENWKKYVDFDASTLVMRSTKDAFERGDWEGHNYNGKPCVFFQKYCRFTLGNIDFEIIEPLSKEPGNPYSDWLIQNGGRSGIHHIGVKLADREVLHQQMEALGLPALNACQMGPVLSDGSRKGCEFYDLRDTLGLIIEACSVVVGPLANDPRAGNPPDFTDAIHTDAASE